jgi:hypothetical protein
MIHAYHLRCERGWRPDWLSAPSALALGVKRIVTDGGGENASPNGRAVN